MLLAQLASREIFAACGMNSSLFGEGDAASTREAWRLCLFGVIAPLGRKVEHEHQQKLEDTVTLEWGELRASDIQGRARSFKSFVDGGLAVESAAAEVGLKNTSLPNAIASDKKSDNRRQLTAVLYLNSRYSGAEDGIRTHDPLLGKEMLYH